MNKINRLFTQAFQDGRDFGRGHRMVMCYDSSFSKNPANLPRSTHVEFPDTPLMHGKPVRRFAHFYGSPVAVLLHPDRLALSACGYGDRPTTRNLLDAFLEAYQLPGYFHQKKGEFCYCGLPFDDRSVFVFDLMFRRLEAVAMPHAAHPILMEVA